MASTRCPVRFSSLTHGVSDQPNVLKFGMYMYKCYSSSTLIDLVKRPPFDKINECSLGKRNVTHWACTICLTNVQRLVYGHHLIQQELQGRGSGTVMWLRRQSRSSNDPWVRIPAPTVQVEVFLGKATIFSQYSKCELANLIPCEFKLGAVR